MISFKEYLLLNEEKDPQINAIKKICKNDFDIILKAGGTGSGSENNIMKKINAEIEDTSKQFKDFNELKEKTKKIISKEKTKNANTKDIEESDSKIEDFYRIIYNNRNIIEQISPHNVSKIRAIFQKVDRNNDKKIDKEEFQNAIKEIQKSIDKNNAAMITYLMYILNVGCSHFAVGQTTGALSLDSNIKPEKFFTDENDKEIKNYFTDEKIKFLNSLFIELKGFTFENSILKNFKTYKAAKSVFSGKTELSDEGFTPKTQEQKEREGLEDEYVKNKEEMNKTQAEIDRLNKETQEILNSNKSNIDDLGNPTKGKWFGLDVDLPVPGDNKELEDFISSIKNVVKEKLKKIVDEVKSYQIKKKKNDLEEDVVLKIIKQKGFKILKEEDVVGLDSGDEEIDEHLNVINNKIEKIILKYENKLARINNKIESSGDYNKKLSLKTDFKLTLVDFGRDINNSFIDLQENIRRKVRSLRNKSWDAELGSHKTLEQKGQEDLNVKKIIGFLKEANKNDAHAIAKYMFINLLAKNSDSEKVYEMLNDKSFSSTSEWSKYVYIGDDKVIYALDKNSVKQDNFFRNILPDVKVLNCGMAKKYRNPKELLSSIGINVNDLTVDVLKRIKKALKDSLNNLSNEANEYLESANKLRRDIAPRASIVTEGLFGNAAEFLKNKKQDAVDYLKGKRQVKADDSIVNSFNTINKKEEQDKENKANTEIEQLKNKRGKIGDKADDAYQNSINKETNKEIDNNIIKSTFDKLTNSMCTNLQIDANKFEPDGHGVEDIPTRQIFKGFVFIKYNNKAFFTTQDRLEKIKSELKAVMKQQSTDEKNYNKAQNAANNTYNANDIENNGKAENLGTTGEASVVTSGAADSTYGNGYNYNKEADAIKKKLNCTTYTYSPNPKMKIVRRTFD